MAIKAVVFDLDGTLVNTVQDLTDAMNYALGLNARPERSPAQCAAMIGNGLRKFVERALGDGAEPLVEEVMRQMLSYYMDHCTVKSTVYAGMTELIDALVCRQVSIAVLTNKGQQAADAIVSHYFPNTFKHVVGATDGNAVKPEPGALLDLLGKLLVKPEDALMIGDSQPDIQVAIAAGVRPVGVTWGFRSAMELKQAGAKIIVNNPKEVLGYI